MSSPVVGEVVLDCPNCKEQSLVRLQHSTDDIFECVYCHHRENLTKAKSPKQEKDKEKDKDTENSWTTILAILFSLALLLPFLAAL